LTKDGVQTPGDKLRCIVRWDDNRNERTHYRGKGRGRVSERDTCRFD
jgi:hypothetical protein